MRIRLTISLCTLFVICCVASSARAQDATQPPAQPKKKPMAASQAKKKPTTTATQTAKKPAEATTQTSAPSAEKKSAATAPAKPTATAQAAAARRAAARKAAAKAAAAKSGNAAKTSTENAPPDAKTETDVKSATDTKSASDTKTPTDAGAPAATQPPTEKKAPTAKKSAARKKPAVTGDAAAPEQTAPAKIDAPKTDATPAKSEATPTKNDAATPATKPGAASKTAKPQAAKGQKKDEAKTETVAFDPAKEAELKAKLEEILKLPAWERIAELKDFLDQELPDALADRASEHLVSAQAAYGDERLQAGDASRGIALFRQAVADASEDVSDKLYYEVVSQLPANLVLRGQPAAAFDLARQIEPAAKGDAKRLLALAAFYLTAEHTADAARLAARAVKLEPDLAAAHQALAAADRLSLRLDESAAEYARAAELDPKSNAARHSVADLRRATGKPEEALAIYRELLAADATDRTARDGVVLALFETGKREEAERELAAALKDDPRDLQLLAGAAYWYAAHGDQKRALELAGQAVQIEPRYPWAQVALARSLVANNLAPDAERALRFARIYSHFPTLDYELASALAASGLYAEAADELAHTFSLKDDQLQARLAGLVESRAPSFIELLAPERRASFFAHDAADTEANARTLKALLALDLALKSTETKEQRAAIEPVAATAAKEFAAGDDPMRAFRQLYAADRLLRRGVASRTALELIEMAKGGVDAAVSTPQATIAVNADELREIRASAINQGGTPNVPDLPRNVLDSFLRGRIEELSGRALLDQGKAAEAVAALRRAVGVLPENSLYWHNALWRLGTALAASGERQEALNTYIHSYTTGEPDPARRAIIESLYRRLNGSLSGLDVLLDAAPPPTRAPAPSKAATVETPQTETAKTDAATTTKPAPTPTADAATAKPEATPEPTPAAPVVTPTPETVPTATPSPTPETPTETATESKKADEKKADEKKADEKVDEKKADEKQAADKTVEKKTDEAAVATKTVNERGTAQSSPPAHGATGECALAVSSDALTLDGGGSASVVATLDGGADASKITATTSNWSDIIVLREPSKTADTNAVKFTVTSISKGGGTYAVTIKSPCGAKQLSVTVK
jgi:tetratricopeptide (TPR) repeat protein